MKIIRIKDYYGAYQEIPVSDELYEEWLDLQRETQRIYRKEISHREKTPMDELSEELLVSAEEEPEYAAIRRMETERLYHAIEQLNPIQQRRIRMLLEEYSLREIAKSEGCYLNSVRKSITAALEKLRMLLSD